MNYKLDDFAYDLPADLIAQEPSSVRHESRLMFVDRQANQILHKRFSHLPELLKAGDVLVVNDTRVIPARLSACRSTGGVIDILLLHPEPARAGHSLWLALATPLKRLKKGEELVLNINGNSHTITVHDIVLSEDGQKRLLLDLGAQDKVYSLLSQVGFAPLPPYIHREQQENLRNKDLERYQTVFAKNPGAVAAPTAGLHFSDELLNQLQNQGVELAKVTLHVGPGTFKPITTSLVDHTIEQEQLSVPTETVEIVNKALADKRRIIAVGTTSCRALETAGSTGKLKSIESSHTSLYIQPGYEFKILGGLITNFHLSRSSLLVLVSAFAGYELVMEAYKQAIEKRYRFFSYGDAMLII
jgi:S-adenosylmethionine:tRNA ribosyltransferase-isomerase